MKSLRFLTLLILTANSSFAQRDTDSVLFKTLNNLEKLDKGYFESLIKIKLPSSNDTTLNFCKCWFEKIHNAKNNFPYKIQINCNDGSDILYYNGINLRRIIKQNLTVVKIDSISQANKYLQDYEPAHLVISVLLRANEIINKSISDSTIKKIFRPIVIANEEYYELKFISPDAGDIKNIHWSFVINKNFLLPIQYDSYAEVLTKDLFQFKESHIINFSSSVYNDSIKYELDSIPPYYKIVNPFQTNNVQKSKSQLLGAGDIMPEWSLNNLADKNINSKNISDKLILIDFSYKRCLPCLKSMPVIEKIYLEYKNKGLFVASIDPYDTDKVDLQRFLKKQNITYQFLLDLNKEAAKKFGVTSYPTLFLIETDTRKIIFAEDGYSERLEENLREKIKEYIN